MLFRSQPQLEGLTGRLERLERQNRRLRLGGALILVGIVSVATMGQGRAPGHAVEAQRFVVKDARGRTRAVLGATADGPGLNLYDPDGNARAALALNTENTSRLGFYDRQGKSRLVVDVAEDGTSTVGFYDKAGKAHAHLRVAPDGSPVLGFFDKDGHPIWPGKLLLP